MAENSWMIVETGGKQHFVAAGSRVIVNRIDTEVGQTISAKNLLDDQMVSLTVVAHTFGPKINGIKFKNKTRYLRRYGHRQPQTVLEVGSDTATKAKTEKVVKSAESKPKPKKATTKKAAK